MASAPIFVGTPKNWTAQIDNADGANFVTLATGTVNGSLVQGIVASWNDTTAQRLSFALEISSTTYHFFHVEIVASDGTDRKQANLLDPNALGFLDPDAPGIPLENGAVLKVAAETAVASGKTIDLVAFGGDY
jgi:hypothetical protein